MRLNNRIKIDWLLAICLMFFIVVGVYIAFMNARKDHKIYIPIGKHHITAYQAVKAQCDSTPDIGAYGRVAKNGKPLGRFFANNKYPKGTQIVIPDVSGDTVWTCMDRMNKRYSGDYIDLLVSKGAIIVGKRTAKVFIVYRP